eukprot:2814134-Rhodomonas_salina.1
MIDHHDQARAQAQPEASQCFQVFKSSLSLLPFKFSSPLAFSRQQAGHGPTPVAQAQPPGPESSLQPLAQGYNYF